MSFLFPDSEHSIFSSMKSHTQPTTLGTDIIKTLIYLILFCLLCRLSSHSATAPSYFHKTGTIPLVYRTIGQQLEITAEKYGKNEALVSCQENIRLTYDETLEKADRLAAGLRMLGLQTGDHIGLWTPNVAIWYIGMMALARAGFVTVGLNPAYQEPEVKYCIKKIKIRAVLTLESFRSQNYYEMLSNIVGGLENYDAGRINCNDVPYLKHVIIDSRKKLPGTISVADVMALADDKAVSKIKSMQSTIRPESVCNIQITSGTTGVPKAAQLTHVNYVNNSFFISRGSELYTKHYRCLVQMPFFHGYATVIILLAGLHNGTTNIVGGPIFNASESVDAIIQERCNFIYGTPTMFVDLVNVVQENNVKIEGVDTAITGGASCSPQLFYRIKKTLGLKKIKSLYGLTEVSAVAMQSLPTDTDEEVYDTVGHGQDHLEFKVIDEAGETVAFGTPGELCIRGYSTMIGYYDDDLKSGDVFDQTRWFKTGDRFILTEDGYGRIVGRIKELIIRGGENISPKEIEDVLGSHPNILDCHVVGVPDERMGEEICAYMRVSNGAITPEAIRQFCQNKIAHFKIPRHIRIVTEFPKTTSGKVQKFKLIEMFKNEIK